MGIIQRMASLPLPNMQSSFLIQAVDSEETIDLETLSSVSGVLGKMVAVT